jgi:hypothetical protein
MENEVAEAIRSGDVAVLNLFLSQNPAAVHALRVIHPTATEKV